MSSAAGLAGSVSRAYGGHVVTYDRDALAGAREAATALATAEGPPAHGAAIDIRFEDRRTGARPPPARRTPRMNF